MEKTFTLRVDLESDKGIKEGLPNLLDLLKKYNLKASFYIPMGGESNIFEILKYRGRLKDAGERKIKVFSLLDKIRMVLFPRDFVELNKKILKRILEEGHELGLHGWKHREWARGLDNINIEKKVRKAKIKYIKLFGKEPISFACPGFSINGDILPRINSRASNEDLTSNIVPNSTTTASKSKISKSDIISKGVNSGLSSPIQKMKKTLFKNVSVHSHPTDKSMGFPANKHKVLEILEEQGIKFISDFQGEEPKYYGGIKNIPITILGKNKMPIIEYLVEGKKDEEILEYIKKQIKEKELISFYIHGLFEARFKLNLLAEIFKFITTKNIINKRIIDY